MLPSEKMARRVELVGHLTNIDNELKQAFTMTATNRVTAAARQLLAARRAICDEMITVGYQPWAIPAVIEESKAI